MKQESVGLNEALVSISKQNNTAPVELYMQTEQCFGCPLKRAVEKSSDGLLETYRLDTRYRLQLELRNAQAESTTNASTTVCHFESMALNSHAHYRIELLATNETGGSGATNCKFETLDSGDCLLCPFAILVCILFAFMVLEWVFVTFVKPTGAREKSSASSSTSVVAFSPGQTTRLERVDSSAVQLSPDAQDPTEAQQHQGQPVDELEESGSTKLGKHRLVAISSGVHGSRKARIECLDAFRGLTIAGMIFVNYGGAGYAAWQHTPWDGITPADLVFPFFIFSMGSSIALSIRAQLKRARQPAAGSLPRVLAKIARRSLVLFALGLCLNSRWLDYDSLADGAKDGSSTIRAFAVLGRLRLTGVLQRFSVSYLFVAAMYAIELTFAKWLKAQSLSQVPYVSRIVETVLELLLAANYLALYVYVTFFVQFDANCPAGYTGPGGQTEGGKYANCTGGSAAWLDRYLLGERHLYNDQEVKQMFGTKISHDPEGVLGFTTSIVLTLIGLQCGKVLRHNSGGQTGQQQQAHRWRLMALGQLALLLALACAPLSTIVPINKRLWSITFVLATGLAATLLVGLLYVLLDVYACRRTLLLNLLISAGKNSLFLYVGHSLIHQMLPWWFPISDPSSHLQLLLRLAWATLVWLAVAQFMARKKLFIRV